MARFNLRRSGGEPARLVVTDPAAAPAPPAPTKLNLSGDTDAPVESAASVSAADSMLDMRLRLHARLIDEIDLSKLDKLDETDMRKQVRRLVGDFARTERLALNAGELDELGASVFDEMVGLGPIEPLL